MIDATRQALREEHEMEEMVMALMVLGIVGGSFLFVGWIIWIVSRRRRERQQHEIELRSRIDTGIEIDYVKNGGVLHYVLRRLADTASAA